MLTTGSLRIQRTPLATLLQCRHADGWRTLRPLRFRADTYFILGTESDWQVQDLTTLATHVLRHEFDPDLPLPDPIEPPSTLRTLSPLARRFLLLICLGTPAAEVASTLSLSASSIPAVNAALSDAELVPLGARVTSEELAALERTHRVSFDNTAQATHALKEALDTSNPTTSNPQPAPSSPTQPIPSTLPPAVLNEVVPVTEAEVQALHARGLLPDPETGRSPTDRRSWPFKKMEPMTKVIIPAELAAAGQRAAHAYASLTRKKFRTTRDRTTGNLIVYRVR